MNKPLTVPKVQALKNNRKISMVTCYDASGAAMIGKSDIDLILVGDSVAMAVHGHPSTLHATLEMMALHVAAVSRGQSGKFIVGDLPFLTFRKGPNHALDCAGALLCAGAHAVKVEDVWGHEETIKALVTSAIPVMGHIGLTPQSICLLGEYKVQGRESKAAQDLMAQAEKLQELGCFSLVLECMPESLAEKITQTLSIPTIGIGAGKHTDGQVLVWHDLLGMNGGFKPKFVREFATLQGKITDALASYHQAVLDGSFPATQEIYGD